MPRHGAIGIKAALAAAIVVLLPGAPTVAQAGGMQSTSCVGGRTSFNCVTRWRNRWNDPHVVLVPRQRDIRDIEERDRLWQVRCRPVVRQDDFGVARYGYAARGCEYGKID